MPCLYSVDTHAAENTPLASSPLKASLFSTSLILQLNKKQVSSTLLESYLETNFTGKSPSLDDAEKQHADFWTPLAGQSKAILGNEKNHWFRLQLHNPSNYSKTYIYSIAPTRGLYVKSVTLPLSQEDTQQLEEPVTGDISLLMKTIFDRKVDSTKKAELELNFEANERKTIIIAIASDNWTIPHFSLKTKTLLIVDKNNEEKFWHLINGIFISMTFFILIGAIISKQSGLLWLPLYSISTLCFLPGYLNYNLQSFNINADKLNTLNIDLCVISLIAFIGVLKYIYSDNALLRRIQHSVLLFILGGLLITINLFTPPKIDVLVYISQIFEIVIALFLSASAFKRKKLASFFMVGPAKLIVLFFIFFILYQASMGAMPEHELFTWLASLILIDATTLTIIVFLIDRYRREEELLKLIATIKKEQQVAAISPLLGKNRHDLRASLSDIIGLSELIIASPLDQEQRKNILDIQQSGRKGLEKINNIFSYKNKNSLLLQNQEPFTLSLLISECAQYYGYRANELNKEIVIDIAECVPEYWKGNHEQIRQLFMHILEFYLSNNDFNEIRINISEFNDNSFNIDFSITSDNNTATPNHKIAARLSTAKLIAEKLGGKLSLEKLKDALLITAEVLASPTVNHSHQQLDLELLKKRRIVIIDDSETSCNVIASYLKRWGVTTFKANNFNDALAIIRHQNNIGQAIDLALIDYIMPNINGVEVSQRLRSDTEVPDNLSIIIMSNTSSSINPIDTKNSGIRQVLDKPVLAHTLRLVLLEEFYLLKSLQAGSTLDNDSGKSKKKILLVEDNPVSAKIVCSMLNRLTVTYEHAATSHEALKKITNNNFDIVLMDCELPDESGFIATRKIRDFEKSQPQNRPPIIIIALTAYDDDNNRQQSIDAGMNDYISKPINLIQLTSIVDKNT
ncbi:MAG: response regulator [Pseudomonadales bacterium]